VWYPRPGLNKPPIKSFARSSDVFATHQQETPLIWGDEHALIGLLPDSVGQVRDAGASTTRTRSNSTLPSSRPSSRRTPRPSTTGTRLMTSSSSRLARRHCCTSCPPHDEHIPPSGSGPRLLDRALDALGDKRIRRIPYRHRLGHAMGHDKQRDAGHRAASAPRLGHLVGTAPRDDRADPADPADPFVEERRAEGRHLEPGVVAAWRVTLTQPLKQAVAAATQRQLVAVPGARDKTHPGRSSAPSQRSSWCLLSPRTTAPATAVP
jgi:hypothetical protein